MDDATYERLTRGPDYLRTALAIHEADRTRNRWGYTTPALRNMLDEELLDLARDSDDPLTRELASRLDRANYYIENEVGNDEY